MDETDVFLTTWDADRPRLEHVRRRVFILEQRVPEEEEWDEDDAASVHVLAVRNREPVGTGRLTPAGKIGRLAVLSEFRGRGMGGRILGMLMQEAARRGLPEVVLHAQVQALPFYDKHGFVAEGEVFEEAGIPHRRMRTSPGPKTVEAQRPKPVESLRILSTLEEVRTAALQVAGAATRLLTMYTPDLEPQLYDQPQFIETVKKLVLASGYAKVRVLLVDPPRAVFDASRFVRLARRITSHIEIRRADPQFRKDAAAFLVADDRAVMYRLDASRWDGIVEMSDPAVARLHLDRFDEVWLASAPDAETRQLHL